MFLFTSQREKRLWLWALVVVVTIFSTLFIGRPLANQLRDQNVQAVFFVLGMFLSAVAIFIHGIRTKPDKWEITTIIGIVAVYVMLFVRLGAPERSHLIEYSVLSIIVFSAITERVGKQNQKLIHALIAFLLTFSIGVIDESIQKFLPNRVFDIIDILFNGMVIGMAILTSLVLSWVRKRFTQSRVD